MRRGRGGGEGVRTRDHFASTRTTLSLVRAGVAMMAAGYGLERLGYRSHALAAVGAGTLLLPLALVRYALRRSRIESEVLQLQVAAEVILVAVVGIGALAILIVLEVSQ